MSGLVGSPTHCRVSENAVTERPPSELASSIPPGAHNVQHYITGIKYSEARYNQVNLRTKTLHAGDGIKHRRETVLVKADLHYAVKCDTWSPPPCRSHRLTLIVPTELREDQTAGGARTSLAERLKPHSNYSPLIRKSFEAEWITCRINEAFRVAAATAIIRILILMLRIMLILIIIAFDCCETTL